MPSFVEFFAGGGFARLGLGATWKCVLANDVSAEKAATYRANHGAGELRLQDVRTLAPSDIPAADLWWASFPCQDHSSAGRRVGFAGDRGSLVFEITRLLHAALATGTGPRLIAMENVTGFVRAAGGRDFVVVHVVRWLAANLLEPLVAGSEADGRPRVYRRIRKSLTSAMRVSRPAHRP